MRNTRNYRFVSYEDDIWLIVGIGYNSRFNCEIFEIVPLTGQLNLFRAYVSGFSITVPMNSVEEIDDPEIIESLLLLYDL